jgi:hypothetical protein
MKKSWGDASRAAEVRQAARAWRDSGVIGAWTLEEIEADYPDARPRLATAWKVLIFFLVSVAMHAVCFGFAEIMHSAGGAGFWIVFGVGLAAVTEALRGSRFAGNGSDAATSFGAIGYLLLGIGIQASESLSHNDETAITVVLVATVGLFSAACLRWGFSVYAAFAAGALFLLFGRFPGGRITWILAGALLVGVTRTHLDRSYPPPLRRAVAAVLAVSAAALYIAVNFYSLDQRWIEQLKAHSAPTGAPSDLTRALSAVATALVPIVYLIWGIRARRTLALDLGLTFTAASLVTLRYYIHVAPLWLVLTLAGALLILGALWLERTLRRAPGGERRGFTAEPLSSAKGAESLQAAAVIAGFTGSPATVKSGELSPGGGRLGGGGSSGTF